jgi:Zn-dependent M28 family amino/carboxypeptidase
MYKDMKAITSLFLFAIISPAGYAQDPYPVSADELSSWAHFLASDEMKGRSNGSPEMQIAASYIAGEFHKAGLKPVPGMEGFLHNFSFQSRRGGNIDERNVIGFIEGSDPYLKNEILVFSSHFDHVGIGRPVDGDSIYNGANDNVAGTATIMGLAHALNRTGARPLRSVVFVAFAGEEMGMRGSTALINDSIIPQEKIFLDLNMEMTGHSTNLGKRTYYLTGPGFSNFDELMDEYNLSTQWKRDSKVEDADRLFFASDNRAFALTRVGDSYKLNIPAFTLCTHGGEDHIHRPHDEPEFMDYDNMADLVNYLTELTIYLSSLDRDRIQWDNKAFEDFMKNRRR